MRRSIGFFSVMAVLSALSCELGPVDPSQRRERIEYRGSGKVLDAQFGLPVRDVRVRVDDILATTKRDGTYETDTSWWGCRVVERDCEVAARAILNAPLYGIASASATILVRDWKNADKPRIRFPDIKVTSCASAPAQFGC